MRSADRISRWIIRKLNSHRFGVPFTSSRKIIMPSFLNLGGKIVRLKFPEEHGIRADFAGIFLDDCYGLQSIKLSNSAPKVLDIGANIGLFSLSWIYIRWFITGLNTFESIEVVGILLSCFNYHCTIIISV